MEKTKEYQNVYALNTKDKIVYIGWKSVESGKKGYYCLGCDAPMIAKKGEERKQHFAHAPDDVSLERKCTYSDETYRHKLAKDILQRLKSIKVPTLYKYPPSGVDGSPNKIRSSWFIEAFTVKNERQFYEDENGNIRYGQDIDFESEKGKHLLIQPDVAFFDKEGLPILLIELVATNDITPEKLAKIKRLGIDTVRVSIPKDSPEAIEECFSHTNRTKWIFNNEREKKQYIPNPARNGEGVLPIDKLQRKLLKAEESYECRKAQLGNLIRGIGKIIQSSEFSSARGKIVAELARTEGNTERVKGEFEALRSESNDRIRRRFSVEESALESRIRELREKEKRIRERRSSLESRYHRKRRELETAERNYQPECQAEIERLELYLAAMGTDPTTAGEKMESIAREESQLEEYYRNEEQRIREYTEKEMELLRELEGRRAELPSEYQAIEAEIKDGFGAEKARLIRGFEKEAAGMGEEFEKLRRRSAKAIEDRDCQGTSSIYLRIKRVVGAGGILENIRLGKDDIRRLKEAKRLYQSGAYKSWN
ncbi:MAG: hypothetical protein KDD15_10990 [Lewinella sp.]|nr:hypothetical protein [Lewinella sp.]